MEVKGELGIRYLTTQQIDPGLDGYKNDDVEAYANATYIQQSLDVYYPECIDGGAGRDGRCPVLFFVHGGAWNSGCKCMYQDMGRLFAGTYGYVTVIVNYRLADGNGPQTRFHDMIANVANAFAWVRNNIQKYHGDPEKIFLMGQSAGGHLVSILAMDDRYLAKVQCSAEDIRGVVSMSGIYNLYSLIDRRRNPLKLNALEFKMYRKFLTDAFGEENLTEEALMAVSPANYIGQNKCPFRLIFAQCDMAGFAIESGRFYRQISELGHSYVDLDVVWKADIAKEAWEKAYQMAWERATGTYVSGCDCPTEETEWTDDEQPEEQEETSGKLLPQTDLTEKELFVGHYAEIVALVNAEASRNLSAVLVTDFIEYQLLGGAAGENKTELGVAREAWPPFNLVDRPDDDKRHENDG